MYFDIKEYFAKEAVRLEKKNPLVHKTVMVNDTSEGKAIKIENWEKELSIFSDADINRSSWKGQFQKKETKDGEVYTSDNEKVPVKEVTIYKRKNLVYGLQILIKNTNSLYTSADTLTYYPDSIYEIRKTQHIRLLSEKNYRITGKFK